MDIPLLPVPGGHLDLIRGQASIDGEVARLSNIEVAVLSVLAEAGGEPVSEEELLRKAWGYRTTKTRTVSMGISRLRGKVEQDPKSPQLVLTVRGVGYRLALAPQLGTAPPLPTRRAPLLGRARAQRRIAAALAEGHRRLELVGPGGVGTSTLARATAGDDAVWVPLRQVVRPEHLVRRLVESLGEEGADGRHRVEAALAEVDTLVLDAAESLDPAAVALLGELLHPHRGVAFLTSRRPLGIGHPLPVAPLESDDALLLLQRARHDAGLPPVSPQLAAPILAEIGGFPLGLTLAAPLVELAGGQPLGLVLGEGGELGTVLRETLTLCSDDERGVLSVASCFAVPPALDDLAVVARRPRTGVLRALHGLRARGLVNLDAGVIDVPVAVAAVARTPAHRQLHARWAGELIAAPMELRRRRHELEAALDAADGDLLPHVLVRHLIVLHAHGPLERLREEGMALLPRIADAGRRHLVLGVLLQSSDRLGAGDAFAKALEQLPDDDAFFRGLAWMFHSVNATWLGQYDVAQSTVEPMLALRDQVSDRAVWASLTNNAASLVALQDEARACRLLAEVDRAFEELPTLAITAAFYRLGLEAPSRSSVAWVEGLVRSVGAERLGPRRWSTYGLRLGRAWLRVGETERGLEQLHAHRAQAMRWDSGLVRNVFTMAALDALDRPAVCRDLIAQQGNPATSPLSAALWYLDGAQGPVPTEDDASRALWEAFRDGEPLPIAHPWASVARALRNHQRRTEATER